jgi:hypothetical protein
MKEEEENEVQMESLGVTVIKLDNSMDAPFNA